ncbi:MAG TPA: glycosyltransferase [Vicinamibacterales bacterium]|nr:glycosyltransferase [Vicinamibacterales bacterium]
MPACLLLGDADLFLQHSVTALDGDEEGLPVSILEAMAEGVPVVSTHHAGIPEAVQDGETGFLVPPGDCQAMADRTVRLLFDEDLRRTMGVAAQKRVEASFSIAGELRELRLVLAKCCPSAFRDATLETPCKSDA